MARLIGPDEASREVKAIVTSPGPTRGLFRSKASRTAIYYVDPDPTATPTTAMLTVLADIRDLSGVAYSGSTVTIDAYSMLPLMQYPDGVDSLLVQVDGGPPWRTYARTDDRIDALDVRVAGLETGGASDALALHKSGAETVTGVKTFTVEPVVPAPTVGTSPATKTYVDAGIAAEATARSAADTTLSGLITTEATSRASGDTGAIAAAAADATSKANAAQAAAIAAAATDATTKANAAQTAAIAAASTDATTKANAAQSAATTAAATDATTRVATETTARTAADVLLTPLTRSISTAAPMTGGGDLSANRTIAVSNATTGAVGVMQLAGDLAGTATAPTVATAAITEPKTAAGLVQRLFASSGGMREIVANDPFFGTVGSRAAFINALDAAEALGVGTTVRLPAGFSVDVVSSLSMSGRSCQIVGAGAGRSGNPGNPGQISVIKATSQAGPVIDYDGYVKPYSFLGKITPLSGVSIAGSTVADPTKANSGIRITSMSSATFRDLAIMGTGGPCLDLATSPGDAAYLCDFERIMFGAPVSAGANDVPWFHAVGANGNRFRSFGFRALTATGQVGVSGAAVTVSDAFTPHDNLFDAWWFEFLHVPTGGTLFHHEGNTSIIRDFQFFDTGQESGGTGTSHFRLAPGAADGGGNIISGYIPGMNTQADAIKYGVDCQQSGNRIVGVRGYKEYNVVLAVGVQRTHIDLGGAYAYDTGGLGPVLDNSGQIDNVIVDAASGTDIRRATWDCTRSATTTSVETSKVTGDTFSRFIRHADGTLLWGSGTATPEVNLYRFTTDNLATDSRFQVRRTASLNTVAITNAHATGDGIVVFLATATRSVFQAAAIGDVQDRFRIFANGQMLWGSGAVSEDTNLYRIAADTLATDDDFSLATAGKGLRVKEGTNAKQGVATLVGGTVTVANTSVTANSRIFLTCQSLGTVAVPKSRDITARIPGTSFTITSEDVTDTSVIAYQMFEPA